MWYSGGTPSKANPTFWEGNIPWVSAKDMKSFYLHDTEDHLTEEGVQNGSRIAPAESILLLVRGMTLHNDLPICIIKQDMAFNQDVKAIIPNQNINSNFLAYWFLAHKPTLLKMVDSASHGTGRIHTDVLKSIEVSLPPLPEQRAIARVLGSLDDKIELNRKMNATLEETARAIFQSWFVDFDPVRAKAAGQAPVGLDAATAALFPAAFEEVDGRMVPQGWDLGVLDDLTEFAIGGDWGSEQPNEINTIASYCIRGADIPFLQGGDLGKMPSRYIKPSSLNKRMLQKGDIVIEVSGGSPTQSTGRSIIILESLLKGLTYPLVYSNFCRMIRLENKAYANYIYLWLRWVYSGDEFLQFENGTTGIKNLAFTLFCQKHRLTIPPLNIIQKFNGIIDNIFLVRQLNAAQSRTLAELRDTLLPRLLSGELHVRDVEPLL